MFASWNLWLVALSYAVATLASFTALDLTRKVRHTALGSMRRIWFCCGSCAMGLGIWSMHFVGMLAWKPAGAMTYQVGLTLTSLLLSIVSSALALKLASDGKTRHWMLLPGGVIMGAGIALMHYTGMSAMDMDSMEWTYDKPTFALSIVIAIAAAIVALSLFRLHSESLTKNQWQYHLLSAGMMGFAICGMHYTGMAAMDMVIPPALVESPTADEDSFWLGMSIGAATLMILGFTLVQLMADGKLSAQIKMGRELQLLLDSTHRTLDLERLQGRVMLNAIDDGVLTVDQQGNVQHANPTALKLIGIGENRIIDQPFSRICRLRHESEDCLITDPLSPVLNYGKVVHLYSQIQLESWDQHYHYIDLKASPLRASHAEIIGAVVILRDISFRREMMNQLEHQAMHDSLTGLNNRRALDQEMLRYRHRLDSDNNFFLFLDLDHFKMINDSCGHAAGDEVLCDFARLLLSHFESSDFVARFGGDEFAVLINCQLKEALLCNVERFRHAVNDYAYEYKGQRYGIGVSIGLVAMNSRFQTTEEVMIAADRACYSAKCSGRNRLKIYEEGDRKALQREHEALWMPRLKEALSDDNFVLYAQRIDPVSENVRQEKTYDYYEILLRYIDKKGNHISPGIFLPVAERGNLMPEIDRWVIRHTFIMLSQQLKELKGRERFAINLSGQSLGDESFVTWIIEQLRFFDIPPKVICFEITETVAVSNFDNARRFMEILSHYGCDFALDDFGSGMSSFAYLAALPVNQIKIDGSFVRELVNNNVNRAIVSSISVIGRSLGLKTVAEFVENDEVLAVLQELGIDFAQGYGIDRPSEASSRLWKNS